MLARKGFEGGNIGGTGTTSTNADMAETTPLQHSRRRRQFELLGADSCFLVAVQMFWEALRQ